MSMRTTAITAALLLTLTSCAEAGTTPDGPSTGGRPEPTQTQAAGQSGVRVVEEGDADLLLWVSNQSFEDETVRLTVTIDGTEVLSRRFAVESQHNWILFPVEAGAGPHVVEVVSDHGATMQRRFTLPRTGKRYAVVDYWNDGGRQGREITWQIQSTPLAFA